MAVVGRAQVLVVPSFKGLQKSVASEMGSVGDAGGRTMGNRISGGFRKAATIGVAAAGGAVAAGLGAALTKGLGRLTSIENAQAKMRGLGHDAKAVDTIMANALTSVKGTAFGLGEAATIAASAVAAGIKPGDELAGHLTRVANNAAAAGVSMDEMGSVFNKAATQANGVQNDVISQLADRGIPIYQALADQMGVTAGEVFKLASEGKVDFETFSKAAEEAAGTVASEMGTTFTGSLANAWAALGRVGANLLSGVFDKFAPAIQGVTGWLEKMEPVATKVGEAIGEFATRAGEAFGRFVQQFRDGEGAGGKFRDVIETIRDAVMVAFDYVRDTVIPAIQTFVEEFRNGEGVGGKFRDVLEGIWTVIKDVFGYVQDRVVPLISDFITGFRDGEGAGGAFRDVLEMIGGALRTAFDFVNDAVVPVLTSMYEWVTSNKQILETLAAAVLGAYAAFKLWTISVRAHAVIMGVINAVKAAHIALSYGLVGATYASATAQRVLNAVMKANPIGILITAIGALVAALVYLYHNNETVKNAIDAAWRVIKSTISAVVTWFKDTAWPWMRDAFQQIGDKAISLKDRAVDAFDRIKSGISRAWDGAKSILDKFKDGLGSLQDKFRRVKDGIASVWGTIGRAFAGPINTVIDTVNKFLNNLESKLNKIPGVNLDLPTIPHVPVPAAAPQGGYAGGWRPGYAMGGVLPGYSPGRDNMHWVGPHGSLSLSGGEAIMRPEWTRAVGSGFVDQMNALARTGGVAAVRRAFGFARGGVTPRAGGDLADLGRGVLDWLDPRKAIAAIYDRVMGGIGGSWAGQVAAGAVKGTIDKLVTWVKDKMFGGDGAEAGGSGPIRGGGMGYRRQWALIKSIFPGAGLSSSYRPNAVTASGYRSYHGLGRAVDLTGSSALMMKMYNFLVGMFGKSSPEIYYGPGGFARRYGKVHYLQGVTAATHPFNHVHWAHSQGGVLGDKPLLFDQGGYLPQGRSIVENRTGRPEPLMRMDKPMRIEGRLRIDDDGFGTLVDARIAADHDHARYESRMVGAR